MYLFKLLGLFGVIFVLCIYIINTLSAYGVVKKLQLNKLKTLVFIPIVRSIIFGLYADNANIEYSKKLLPFIDRASILFVIAGISSVFALLNPMFLIIAWLSNYFAMQGIIEKHSNNKTLSIILAILWPMLFIVFKVDEFEIYKVSKKNPR